MMNTISTTKDTKGHEGIVGLVKAFVLFVSFVVMFPVLVEGHEARPGYLEIKQTTEESYDVLWKVPGLGPNQRLSLNLRFPPDTRHIALSTPAYISASFVERFTIERSDGLSGSEIYVEGLRGTLTDVLARVVNLNGITQTARLSPDKPFFVVASIPDSFEVSKTYTVLGIQHILEGIDHLLFVACLLLVAGLGRKLIITITGFTLAHSVTLALVTLDIVRVPIPPVEAVIALSIVFLAVEIARKDKEGLTYRYPVAVSVSFGLLHGFGFAAVLGEIGLPSSDIPLALLFFNVGVELGQLLFIGAMIFVFYLVAVAIKSFRRHPDLPLELLRRSELFAAYVIGGTASFWTIGRIVGFW